MTTPPSRAAHWPKCGECARPILLDRPVALEGDTFRRALDESSIPVLVDFYADWCGPCKMMAPVFDRVSGAMRLPELERFALGT